MANIKTRTADCTPNIVIVGGGMVGLSLALLIEQQQQSGRLPGTLTLIEQGSLTPSAKTILPSFDDRSTALSAGSLEILNGFLDGEALRRSAEKILTVHVSDRGHLGGTQIRAEDHQLSELGLVIENKQLGQVLLKAVHASGVECVDNARVKQCRAKAGGYELEISRGDEVSLLHADLLLIADGADSPIRQALGIHTQETHYQQTALIANVAMDRPHDGVAFERFTADGPMALLPQKHIQHCHRSALVWTLPELKVEAIKAASEQEILRRLHNSFGFRAGKFLSIGQRSFYPLSLIKAEEQVRSQLVVVGNAAHILHPVAGQGFNLSLRDCQRLVTCLVQSYRNSRTQQQFGCLQQLQTYLHQQTKDQRLTIGLTDQMVKVFSSQQLPLMVLRQLGFLSLTALPLVKKQFTQQLMGC